MRIAVNTISTKKGSGGAYQIAYNFLMETLRKQDGVEWYYITSTDVDELVGDKFIELRGIRYFVFPTQPDFLGSYRQVKKELAQWEKDYSPDVIYTISSPCYFTFKTPEVMRFANAWVTNPNKESWSVMPWKDWIRMRLYRINQFRLLRKGRFFITQSETVKQGLLRITGLPSERIAVVPNVLPKVFQEAVVEKVTEKEWIDIVCAAALVPHKNLDIIPNVLRSLRDKHKLSNVRFHLTIPEGNAVLGKIRLDCEAHGLGDRIVNHGRCAQEQLIDVYNRCSICFLPTLLETFSASSLEAMHFKLFIVTTDFSFNREVIADAGLYYKPMDANGAAEKIAIIIRDKKLQHILSEKMSERIKLFNDYGHHFNGIVKFLKTVVENTLI